MEASDIVDALIERAEVGIQSFEAHAGSNFSLPQASKSIVEPESCHCCHDIASIDHCKPISCRKSRSSDARSFEGIWTLHQLALIVALALPQECQGNLRHRCQVSTSSD